MRVLAASAEDEMIALFLQTELRSERFRPELARLFADDERDPAVVAAPDINDPVANAYRRQLCALGLLLTLGALSLAVQERHPSATARVLREQGWVAPRAECAQAPMRKSRARSRRMCARAR